MSWKQDVSRRNFVKGGLCMACAAGSSIVDARSTPTPRTSSSTDAWPPAQVLADFDELYPRLRESHYDLYARRPKNEYDRQFKAMRRQFEQAMPRHQVIIGFQKFLAYGRVAHAYCGKYWAPFDQHVASGGRQFPLDFKVVRGKAYVTSNQSDRDEIAIGDEITHINGMAFAEVRARLHGYISADNDYLADTLLEQQVPVAMWFEFGDVPKFDVHTRKPDGATHALAVPTVTLNEIAAYRESHKPAPKTDWNQRTWKMLESDVGYLRPGPFYNHGAGAEQMYDTASFAGFIDDAFKGLSAVKVKSLIIDLRNNPGGDNSFSDLMVSWVADEPFKFASEFRIKVSPAAIDSNRKRVEATPGDENSASAKLAAAYAGKKPGEVISYDIPTARPRSGERYTGACHVLVNRYSYSNAVNVAALMQDYGFAKILGEETADLATTYGAMETFKLPRTGIDVGFPKALIIRPNGSLAARGVIPDTPIETPLVEGNEDVVLAKAVRAVRAA